MAVVTPKPTQAPTQAPTPFPTVSPTLSPTTLSPTTSEPTTAMPTTQSPTTLAPTTLAPTPCTISCHDLCAQNFYLCSRTSGLVTLACQRRWVACNNNCTCPSA